MDNLLAIENQRGIILPENYKVFYKSCSLSIPDSLIGADLINNSNELNQWALELLAENGIENFLESEDFVFMMHQGYMFWYFKADGNPDPVVYGYHEKKKFPDKLENFSEFIKGFI